MTRLDIKRAGISWAWVSVFMVNFILVSFAFSSSNQISVIPNSSTSWETSNNDFREGESALEFGLDFNDSRIPPSSELNLLETFTLEGWIRPSGWGEGPNYIGTILHKPSIWLFIIDDHPTANDRSLLLQLRHDNGVSHSFSPVGSIALDAWTHIAVSYNSVTSEVKMYINGMDQEVSHIAPPSGSVRNNLYEGFELGSIPPGTMNFLGIIDEVRIWSEVRSPGEIFHNMSSPLMGDETGLQLYYPMNEGGGDELHDLSGNGHDINISGVNWTYGTPFHPTSIEDTNFSVLAPEFSTLSSNYPNPFNPSTIISFALDRAGVINLTIYDIHGAEIETLAAGHHAAGHYNARFTPEDLSSGTYLYVLDSESFRQVKRMLYLK